MQVDKLYKGVAATDVGRVIRNARKRARITEHGLAERAGISRQTVVQCELGYRYPTPATALALARVLGLRASELMKGKCVYATKR